MTTSRGFRKIFFKFQFFGQLWVSVGTRHVLVRAADQTYNNNKRSRSRTHTEVLKILISNLGSKAVKI